MCEFCKPEEIGNGMCNELGFTSVGMGSVNDLFGLEVLMTSDASGSSSEIVLVLVATNGGAEVGKVSIPIKYCPVCGRKL